MLNGGKISRSCTNEIDRHINQYKQSSHFLLMVQTHAWENTGFLSYCSSPLNDEDSIPIHQASQTPSVFQYQLWWRHPLQLIDQALPDTLLEWLKSPLDEGYTKGMLLVACGGAVHVPEHLKHIESLVNKWVLDSSLQSVCLTATQGDVWFCCRL